VKVTNSGEFEKNWLHPKTGCIRERLKLITGVAKRP
jgi:hypothetical protein